PFDLIFIDADKPSTPEYFEWAVKLSKPGTMIIVDNVVRDGEVANAASRDANVQGIREFYERAAQDERVDGTAMQTVGVKGYDGLAILVVIGNDGRRAPSPGGCPCARLRARACRSSVRRGNAERPD